MANTFITPTMVARDAAITLHDRLITGDLVTRDKERMFTASKVGDTVPVTVPPILVANEFTGTTTPQDITETSVNLELEHHYEATGTITSKQSSLELSDFTRLVTVPSMDAIMDAIDDYFITQIARGFTSHCAGTRGTQPSSKAHILAANKILKDNKVKSMDRIGLISTTAEASFMALNEFVSADYGQDGTRGLREAYLTRRYGVDWFVDANSGTQERGDVAGTVLTNGIPVLGASTLAIDGFTAATGDLYEGAAFTVAGDTTEYALTADASITGNAATVSITPVVSADLVAAGDGAAVTFLSAVTENMIYNKGAVAGAIVAPTPLRIGSAVESYRGISVRATFSSSTVTLSDQVVFDVFCGCQVIQPVGGVILQG